MINQNKIQFCVGLTPEEAAVELQIHTSRISSHQAPVTILPKSDETLQLPVWTRDALASQRRELQELFPNAEPELVVLPNNNTQRLLISDLTDTNQPQANIQTQSLFETLERPLPISERLSLSVGPNARPPNEFSTTVNEALERAAIGNGELICINKTITRISYSGLLHQALSILGGLQQADLKRRNVILVDMRDAQLGIAGLFACMLGDFIPAPIMLPEANDARISLDRFTGALHLLDPTAILTSSPLNGLNLTLPQVFNLAKLSASPIGKPCRDINPSETALIILTSGSTGSAKGVHQSHSALMGLVWGYMICGHELGPNDRMMNWMPLDHVGSLAFALIASIAASIPLIQVETALIMGSPEKWVEIASKWKATITWFPNFAFRLLAEHAPSTGSLETLRRIVSGGEAIQAEDTALFLKHLSPLGLKTKGVIAPSFGMSESCSGVSFSLNEPEIRTYACLGRPTPNSALRIVDENLNLLPEGKIGHLQVSGNQLLLRYHGQTGTPLTSDGWFQTGDLGFIVDGALYLTGRIKDVININGQKYFPQDIEHAARLTPGLDSAYIIAVPYKSSEAVSESLVILFAPKFSTAVTDDLVVTTLCEGIRAAIRDRINLPVQYCLPLPAQDIPRTNIGKVNRSVITAKLLAGEYDPIIRRMSCLEGLSPTINVGLHRIISCAVVPLSSKTRTALCIELNAKGGAKLISHDYQLITPKYIPALVESFNKTSESAYSLILSIAKMLLQLTPAEIPDSIQVILKDFSAATLASLIGLIRSLRLSQSQNWQAITCSMDGECDLSLRPEVPFARLTKTTHETDKLQRFYGLPPLSTQHDGFWIIAGGLGGIGRNIAKKLDAAGLSIICVGRKQLADLTPEQHKFLKSLSHAAYLRGDLCDSETLSVAAAYGKSLFSKSLAGVILAAGSGQPIHLSEETPENYDILSKPLLTGLDTALKITTDHPGACVTIIGSVMGFLGGRVHGYAAAHAALFDAAKKAVTEGYPVSYIGFSAWKETGLSAGATSQALLARDGLQFISAETGSLLVEAVRRRPGMLCLAGINDMHPAITSYVDSNSQSLVRLAGVIQTLIYPGAIEAVDALGRTTLIAARPSTASEDEQSPLELWKRSLGLCITDMPPEGPVERVLANQFRTLLGLQKISRDDDFFACGGTSITAARLVSIISRLFFIDISISLIFQNSTPRKLASDLVAREIEPGITKAAAEQIEIILGTTLKENDNS